LAQVRSPLQKRFLFVTGDVLAPQTQEFLERNQIPHVAKPFRVEELTARINTLLDDDDHLARRERAAAEGELREMR
jgi:DNA-binding response OmpR family regulator